MQPWFALLLLQWSHDIFSAELPLLPRSLARVREKYQTFSLYFFVTCLLVKVQRCKMDVLL